MLRIIFNKIQMGTCCSGPEGEKYHDHDAGFNDKAAQSVSRKPTKPLVIGTLNYGGIINSPFEFYIAKMNEDLERLNAIFYHLLRKYIPDFDPETFQWKCSKIDKHFRVGRYSPMFDYMVGLSKEEFLTKPQFHQKWQQVFKARVESQEQQPLEWDEQGKSHMKLYDTLMQQALYEYCFGIQDYDDVQYQDWHEYVIQVRPFFELAFLNKEKKQQRFLGGLERIDPDIFFVQEYAQQLHQHLLFLSQGKYRVVVDASKDTMIIVKNSAFEKVTEWKDFQSRLPSEVVENLTPAKRTSFLVVDNIILVGLHLNSKAEQNLPEIEKLKLGLVQLKEAYPEYEIVVAGDLNSYLELQGTVASGYNAYPSSQQQFTTLKKRTYTQAQFNKANKIIKESKDKIISTLPMGQCEISTILGEKPNQKAFLPSAGHPFDHFAVIYRSK